MEKYRWSIIPVGHTNPLDALTPRSHRTMNETELREINAAMLKAENRLSALATDRCDKTVLDTQQYTGKAFGMIRALVKYPDTRDTAALNDKQHIIDRCQWIGEMLVGCDIPQSIYNEIQHTLLVEIPDDLDRLAALVQAESEACAKLCESYTLGITQVIAKEIRARSTPTPPTDA